MTVSMFVKIENKWVSLRSFLWSILIVGVTLAAIFLGLRWRSSHDQDAYLRFPKGFTVGAGSSAYQIEGAWNASGKGESVWDRFVHTQPSKIADRSNGDVACDSYHKYKDDVQWLKKLGIDDYRFSISWTRVLPTGFPDFVSTEGLRYYHNLIDELLANDIQPIVTLYHWDHPQVLEDMGGWLNESMIIWFTDYADVIFRELGPKVKVFSTLNEITIFCQLMYVDGVQAPGKQLNKSMGYLCGHNALKAHARAYHLYDKIYRPTQHGEIGTIISCPGLWPKIPNDTETQEFIFQDACGMITHPIYVGDYHNVVKTGMARANRNSGHPESRLLELSPEWIEYIKGTSDYIGLIHYTTRLVEVIHPDDTTGLDVRVELSVDPNWEGESRKWIYVVPEGFGHVLRKIKEEYNNPTVYIMENGISDNAVDDYLRLKYLHSYLRELLLAVNRDGCNVRKYIIWCLMDNFEWADGYNTASMGLIHVNFSSPDLKRTPRLSFNWLQGVMRARRLQPPILRPKGLI